MIGPDIPPHLLQNVNADTASGDEGEGPGPSIGPQIPDGVTGTSRPPEESNHIGPQIPPALLQESKQEKSGEEEEEEEEEDDYGPALPPELLVQRSNPSTSKPKSPSHELSTTSSTLAPASGSLRRTMGPSFPSHPSHYYQEDDSDDDDFGPKPLPSGLQAMHEKDAVAEFMEREERRRKNEEKAKEPKALKREEWMLVPPSASDLLGNLDTTKLKARQFARTSGPVNKRDNNLWTETPAERQQRIADEVAGKKRRAVDVANEEALGVGSSSRKRSKQEEESIRRGVDEYTRTLRGPSLVEQHTSRKNIEDEDDGPKAIWDHSRDMALGGRLMDDGKRNQMIRDSKGLGDRFGSGGGGSFL
ncbi:hypothetical protein D9756_004384 [Leucocoprinus leucothites]|uniref:DUF3752 domain-containing protein n=1 Tax=Leucocoprinus leucothites TaxID=201217 RepID=A0A8H5G048_9AGAR|nr:hypothetical protein D9756_004384 [Leucoagaricus leucothites]